MHVEVPKERIGSLREFGVHYLLIVLSILTALGLEQLLATYHHAEAAQASRQRILAEIAANLDEVRAIRKYNGANLKAIRDVREELLADIQQNRVTPDRLGAMLKRLGPAFIVQVPSMRRDSWDAAIADQSATYIAPADLRRFSEIYSAERDVVQLTQILFSDNWTAVGADIMLAGELNHLNAEDLARLLTRFVLVGTSLDSSLGDLEKLLAADEAKPAG
jgi:hypothetical protein